MTKSSISCGSLENPIQFSTGDLVGDEEGSIYLVTDNNSVVVIHCKHLVIGSVFAIEGGNQLNLVPRRLSVTLTQD